jgi:hypothetical protein
MSRSFAVILTPEAWGLVSLGAVACGAILLVVRARRRKKPTPEELEARRREWLSKQGKLAGGEILEVQENLISYHYDVRGLSYSTSQDVSALQDRLPEDRWSIVGGVGVRYDRENPANSIVLSETWTGLRQRNPKPASKA